MSLIRVLLIEDNEDDALLVREKLAEVREETFDVEWVSRLADGVTRLAEGGVDAVLLDLSLPDSHGLDTFMRLRNECSGIPILILSGLNDESVAVEAVQQGAQDYLIKGEVRSGTVLARMIRYALERHRFLAQEKKKSFFDDVTGVYNRTGFFTLVEHHVQLAARRDIEFALFFADVDDLKGINDTFGHAEGTRALKLVGEILQETFRRSDLIARVGGDEFVIVASGPDEAGAKILIPRLQEKLNALNERLALPYPLTVSLGAAYYDPRNPCSVEELLAKADAAMYDHKRRRNTR